MLLNSTPLEESIKLNNRAFIEKIVELEEKIADRVSVVRLSAIDSTYQGVFYIQEREESGKYIVSVGDEIVRLLSTPLGSRVMRPEYGSELYKLRDRELSLEWRLMATKYTFVAINNHIERVRCRKVLFEVTGDGEVQMNLKLEPR